VGSSSFTELTASLSCERSPGLSSDKFNLRLVHLGFDIPACASGSESSETTGRPITSSAGTSYLEKSRPPIDFTGGESGGFGIVEGGESEKFHVSEFLQHEKLLRELKKGSYCGSGGSPQGQKSKFFLNDI
jgi:hypothetical protein